MTELYCLLLLALFAWAAIATALASRATSQRRRLEREIDKLLEE